MLVKLSTWDLHCVCTFYLENIMQSKVQIYSCLYFGKVEQKFCGIETAQETSDTVSLLITSQQLTVIQYGIP